MQQQLSTPVGKEIVPQIWIKLRKRIIEFESIFSVVIALKKVRFKESIYCNEGMSEGEVAFL